MCGHKRNMQHAICRMQRKYRMQATCGMQPYTSARDSAWDTQAVFVIAVSVPLKCLQEFMEEQVALDALTFARSEDEIGLATKASFARLKVRRTVPTDGDVAAEMLQAWRNMQHHAALQHATACTTQHATHIALTPYRMHAISDMQHAATCRGQLAQCVSDSVKCTVRRTCSRQQVGSSASRNVLQSTRCTMQRTACHGCHATPTQPRNRSEAR